ncbi:uncharacterized protein LOC143215035 [Lasioglossum baleicum]|uniref:uncharacterized protein LOC143215035 n=1 Tax=Lasioglossum baleicum TaxID=434251 RepID=UPI003FCDD727
MSSASTGGTEGSSPASSPASATSLTMAAPKYGTLVPNRIFVGGISANTSPEELTQLFSSYGNVKATKIIADRAGVSKGYGFVTFETEEEAKRLQREPDCIVLRERKLNIAPAIKKQPFNRSFDGGSGSPPSVPTNTYYYPNGMGLYQNGMYCNTMAPAPTTPIAPPTDPATIYQTTGVFGPQAAGHQTFAPVMYPCPAPSLFMPQQYPYSPMPYETYYPGAAAAGASPYLYPSSNSQSNANAGNNNSGNGNNGTAGATSPQTGPPPAPLPSLPPQAAAHFYPAAPPPHHHHPSVPAGPPQTQVDHLYYPFAAGAHPPPPPHAAMGIADQQMLLYPTDTSCQQTSSSDGQGAPQEDSRSTSSHSEQPHSETTQAAAGSSAPMVSLMPVKFPVSGRYPNYHSIAIHSANLYNSQSCLNEAEDCAGNRMHCRTIVYHPATVYIPHAHTTAPYANASVVAAGASLLPTPGAATAPSSSVSQQIFDSSAKPQSYLSSRDYSKSGPANGQNSYSKGSHGIALSPHQPAFAKPSHLSNSQSYKHANVDGGYNKYPASMGSRFSVQCNQRRSVSSGASAGGSSTVQTSPACYAAPRSDTYSPHRSGNVGGYVSNLPPVQSYNSGYAGTSQSKMYVASGHGYGNEYANGRRSHSNDQYADHAIKSSTYSSRKNTANVYRNNGQTSEGNIAGSNSRSSSENYNATLETDGTGSNGSQSAQSAQSSTQSVQNTAESSSNSEKPVSPPPAPYSPMTRPLPTLSPPTSQVPLYVPAQTRYQPSLAPSQHHHQQQQQQQQQQSGQQQRRYAIPPAALSAAGRKTTEKYSSSGSTQNNAILRQSKYKVNGIMQTGNKVSDDSLGGAGDAPPGIGRMPITPPGTPRALPAHSTAADQNQLGDTCHQMQALSL